MLFTKPNFTPTVYTGGGIFTMMDFVIIFIFALCKCIQQVLRYQSLFFSDVDFSLNHQKSWKLIFWSCGESVGPCDSDLSILNRCLQHLQMTVTYCYILYRLHPFHELLCNLMFPMMLYNNVLFVSNLRHQWFVNNQCRSEYNSICIVEFKMTRSVQIVFQAGPSVRHKCLQALLRMIYDAAPELLKNVLKSQAVAR